MSIANYPTNKRDLSPQLASMIAASDGAWNDNFGESVSISGETVVVGALLEGDAGTPANSRASLSAARRTHDMYQPKSGALSHEAVPRRQVR